MEIKESKNYKRENEALIGTATRSASNSLWHMIHDIKNLFGIPLKLLELCHLSLKISIVFDRVTRCSFSNNLIGLIMFTVNISTGNKKFTCLCQRYYYHLCHQLIQPVLIYGVEMMSFKT